MPVYPQCLSLVLFVSFGAVTLLAGWQEWHLAHKEPMLQVHKVSKVKQGFNTKF